MSVLYIESKSILCLSHNVAVNLYFTVSSLNLIQKTIMWPTLPSILYFQILNREDGTLYPYCFSQHWEKSKL